MLCLQKQVSLHCSRVGTGDVCVCVGGGGQLPPIFLKGGEAYLTVSTPTALKVAMVL